MTSLFFPVRSAVASVLMLVAPLAGAANPLRVLAIGDSMTEEYAFEVTFSAPDSKPTNANTRNWTELFRLFRPNDVTLGTWESTGGSYLDLRNAGHRMNFGVPGFTTRNWVNLLNGTPGDDPLGPLYGVTKEKLEDEVWSAQVIVILIGANDLKQDYNDLFNSTEPAGFFDQLLQRLNLIYAWANNSRGPTARPEIVVCTLPDVGATPQISGTYRDPAKMASTRAKIAAFNRRIVDWAAARPFPPSVARIDLLTDRVFDQVPFQVKGTLFTLSGDRENPPTQVFCKDGFHASTVAQAFIANEIIRTLNTATGRNIPEFTEDEILKNVLGLNPDQPYLDWIAASGLPGSSMEDDPDGDGLPNLAEYVLGTSPRTFGRPFAGDFAPGSAFSWRPDPVGLRFANLIPEESVDLENWTPLPSARILAEDDGRISVAPAAGETKSFLRLQAVER